MHEHYAVNFALSYIFINGFYELYRFYLYLCKIFKRKLFLIDFLHKMKRLLLIALTMIIILSACKRTDIAPIDHDDNYSYKLVIMPDDEQYDDNAVLFGVAADGESVIRIRLVKCDAGAVVPSSIKLEVASTDYGLLSEEIGGSGMITIIDNNPELKTFNGSEFYEYFYHAPSQFIGNNDSIMVANISVTINDEDANSIVADRRVSIIRTPIMFIHGFNSEGATYNTMINSILSSYKYKKGALYAVDYAETSFDAYTNNANVVPNGIIRLKAQLLTNGFITKKVNIVAHSMGGALTRNYLQGDGYRNDIGKFISIDAVHSGTQVANLGISLANKYPETILGMLSSWGCLVDFQVDSEATRDLNGPKLNKHVVPSHVFSASFGSMKHVAALIGEKQYLQAVVIYLVGDITSKVYNEDNDILVPVSGQKAGLTSKEVTHYDGEWHCSILTKAETANEINRLFDLSSSDRAYSKDGFNPPTLTYNPQFANDLRINIYTEQNETITSDKVIFTPNTEVESTLILVINPDNNKIVNAVYNENSGTTFNIEHIGNMKKAELHFIARTRNGEENSFVYSKKTIAR